MESLLSGRTADPSRGTDGDGLQEKAAQSSSFLAALPSRRALFCQALGYKNSDILSN